MEPQKVREAISSREFGDRLMAFCMAKRLFRSRHDAEEAVQEALIVVLTSLRAGKSINSPYHFARHALKYKAIDQYRALSRNDPEPLPDDHASHDQALSLDDHELIEHIFAGADERLRNLLQLVFLGRTIKQAAEEIEVSRATLHRWLASLYHESRQ